MVDTRKRAKRLVLLLIAAVVGGEVFMRLVDESDVDGNVVLFGRRLPPYRFPGMRMKRILEGSQAPDSYLQYSSTLGWEPKARSISANGWYSYNSSRVRVSDPSLPTEVEAAVGCTRIVLIGDSFMHGDDVPFADSLGARLGESLGGGKGSFEVLNLAMSGYGMDQALLRLRQDGLPFSPDIVIFGFQPENIGRNLNILRGYYYWKSTLPFSKPRFLLADGQLELVNMPTVSPETLGAVLLAGGTEEILRHEWFHDEEQYAPTFARRLRLLALAEKAFDRLRGRRWNRVIDLSPEGEPGRLALAIMEAMQESAGAISARLMVVYIPRRIDLEDAGRGRAPRHGELLDTIREGFEYVDPEPMMVEARAKEGHPSLFVEDGGHYSGAGNQLVADALAEAISD